MGGWKSGCLLKSTKCLEGVKMLVTDGWDNAHEDALAGVYTRNVIYTEVL
jgi:hypothetical protein